MGKVILELAYNSNNAIRGYLNLTSWVKFLEPNNGKKYLVNPFGRNSMTLMLKKSLTTQIFLFSGKQ